MADEKNIGLLMNGISLSPDVDEKEACVIAANEMKRAGISPARLRFEIYKRSVDARKKDRVRLVYSVAVRSKDGGALEIPQRSRYGITPLYEREIQTVAGTEKSPYSPLIVGMGPAGLFCALLLAEQGYRPTIIDRGDSVAERTRAHRRFSSHS